MENNICHSHRCLQGSLSHTEALWLCSNSQTCCHLRFAAATWAVTAAATTPRKILQDKPRYGCVRKHAIHAHSGCWDYGTLNKTFFQQLKTNKHPAWTTAWCHLCSWSFQKTGRNIFPSRPRRLRALSFQPPTKMLTKASCPPEYPHSKARTNASLQWGTGAASRRLSSPTLLLSASLGTSLTLAPDEGKGSLAPCITDATESCTRSQLLCWWYFLSPWQQSRWHTTLPSDCPGGHRRPPALRDLPRPTTEQLIMKSDDVSWKQWGKHHQDFNYCPSAASHGTITNKHPLLLASR